jgi:hypothetical protein
MPGIITYIMIRRSSNGFSERGELDREDRL